MQKISYIYPSDLAALQIDASGNYLVPEGFEIYKVPTPEEVRAARIAEINMQLANFENLVVPSDEELVELGKMMHPYYVEQMQVEILKEELKGLV
jgi:hypothetical protein